jgi:hypothetical protein
MSKDSLAPGEGGREARRSLETKQVLWSDVTFQEVKHWVASHGSDTSYSCEGQTKSWGDKPSLLLRVEGFFEIKDFLC